MKYVKGTNVVVSSFPRIESWTTHSFGPKASKLGVTAVSSVSLTNTPVVSRVNLVGTSVGSFPTVK